MSDRIYRFLLHAYPADFREEYGAQLAQLFRDRQRDSGALSTWLLAIADLARTAPSEHLDVLFHDLKSAARFFLANPGFAAVSVLCLALGLGANTTIFSLLNAALFTDLPVREPHELVSISRGGLGDSPPFSYPDYQDLSAHETSFSDLFIHSDLLTFRFGSGVRIETAGCEMVSLNYFETLGIGASLGRTFASGDEGQPVIVLSSGLWRRRFGAPSSDLRVIVSVAGDPASFIAPVLDQIQAANSSLPVIRIGTMKDLVSQGLGPQRGTATLVGLFGMLALALAAVGIYGVIAHSVAQRTHEIGIRVAMGALGRNVVRMIVIESLTLAVVGIVAGAALALAIAHVIGASLYGVSPADPAAFISIALLWLLVAAVAAWLPARRAARLDPLLALRCE